MNAQPGWFPDPVDATRMRWWNGRQWTDAVGRDGVSYADPLPPEPPAEAVTRRRRVWPWVLAAVVILPLLLFVSPLLVLISLAVLLTGIVALTKGTPTWLRFRSRGVAIGATAAAAVVLLISGSVSAAVISPQPAATTVAEASQPATPTPTRTPTPTHTPVTTTRQEVVTEAIPFERTTVEDAALPRGETRITAGADGELRRTYTVTTVDGEETSRELVEEVVSVQPVTEVTTTGAYDAPVAQASAPECDPNYADGCVPIASDVDCAGGSGNGPAYFSGTARVVGVDIYDLDRDGDGIACDS